MPNLDWDRFKNLDGSDEDNFELLCRGIVRAHSASKGTFRSRANQPGVEFHVKYDTETLFASAGSHVGWQCKWFDTQGTSDLLASQKQQILSSIEKTQKHVKGITDWVLWTRYPLTNKDQKWIDTLDPGFAIELWTGDELDNYLCGPASLLRETFFEDLILDQNILAERHALDVAQIRSKWLHDAHQRTDPERVLDACLLRAEEWGDFKRVVDDAAIDLELLESSADTLTDPLKDHCTEALSFFKPFLSFTTSLYGYLTDGKFTDLATEIQTIRPLKINLHRVQSQLRSGNHEASILLANLIATVNECWVQLSRLKKVLSRKHYVLTADAGCGKSQIAAELSAPGKYPAGILLHGTNLSSKTGLDDFANNISFHGKSIQTFDSLLAAMDSAGQRLGCRIPLVIDGLNESEDPRDWKKLLPQIQELLRKYDYVAVITTIRPQFSDCVPKNKQFLTIKSSGLGHDANDAIRRYFDYYKIRVSEVEAIEFSWSLLSHPLTLRIFCEVTNLDREDYVDVESMPLSLSPLFDRYIQLVANRVSDLSQVQNRLYPHEVEDAIYQIGHALWKTKGRSVELKQFQKSIGDDAAWSKSLVRELEQDGIVVRAAGENGGPSRIELQYDMLAGHVLANAIIADLRDKSRDEWLKEIDLPNLFTTDWDNRHPLRDDLFKALSVLMPVRVSGLHLWHLVEGELREDAIVECRWLDNELLDRDTVEQLAKVSRNPRNKNTVLQRAWTCRALKSHPLNAMFLHDLLSGMSMTERDLFWSEWLRSHGSNFPKLRSDEAIEDICAIEDYWDTTSNLSQDDYLRAVWIHWLLTSTVRDLRDHATRALVVYGTKAFDSLTELTLNAIQIGDIYVIERVLAACYGSVMRMRSSFDQKDYEKLGQFAETLLEEILLPDAKNFTSHALIRDYALGIIELCLYVAPGSLPKDKLDALSEHPSNMPTPFVDPNIVADKEIHPVEGAIRMDFGNYTIGRLIEGRGNYDYQHHEYKTVYKQIEQRIVDLGYTNKEFFKIDKSIGELDYRHGREQRGKIDRYGKKYSWIAYFEMFFYRVGKLDHYLEHSTRRPSEIDIDPSFPSSPDTWRPDISNIFAEAPVNPVEWVTSETSPDMSGVCTLPDIDGVKGPWVLLDGYIETRAHEKDMRRIFTFLRGLLVREPGVESLLDSFYQVPYPGNDAIPQEYSDYYVFAGETPWSSMFAQHLTAASGQRKRDIRVAYQYHQIDGRDRRQAIELTSYRYGWEREHSQLCQAGGALVPAPAICQHCDLRWQHNNWDMNDSAGQTASIYREFNDMESSIYRSHLLYLRSDLMDSYLKSVNMRLLWLNWGERTFEYKFFGDDHDDKLDLVRKNMQSYDHIHRTHILWAGSDSAKIQVKQDE